MSLMKQVRQRFQHKTHLPISATTALILIAVLAYVVTAIATLPDKTVGVIGLVGLVLIVAWDIRQTVKRNNEGGRIIHPPQAAERQSGAVRRAGAPIQAGAVD